MKTLNIEKIGIAAIVGAAVAYGALITTVSAQGGDIEDLKKDRMVVYQTKQRVEDIAAFFGVPQRKAVPDAK